ncbi:MAG TPA: hypothetical protein VKZ77_07935 [Bacillaceae bacterium]|nr:hypothetical protein [Paenibacillus bovis]HLU22400.1 hypothetical protein [Bacillaceae bacterium]
MLKTVGLIFAFAAISFFHLRPLVQKRMLREIVIFSICMLAITALSAYKLNGGVLPNPLELIAFLMKPLSKILI